MTTHAGAAKRARMHKEARPDLYCPYRGCLWRTEGGYCPRHAASWTCDRCKARNPDRYENCQTCDSAGPERRAEITTNERPEEVEP